MYKLCNYKRLVKRYAIMTKLILPFCLKKQINKGHVSTLYHTQLIILLMMVHLALQFNQMNFKKIIGTVGDLQLDIKPRSLFFQGGRSKHFTLYIEKGRQVIGQFKSDLKQNTKENQYLFSSYQPSYFRLTNVHNTHYSWNIYYVNANEMSQTYMDTTVFDIKSFIQAYQTEIAKKQKELQTLFKDHCSNPEATLQIWKKMKSQLTSRTLQLECLFKKEKIHLQFVLNIKNVLDLQLAEIERQKTQRKLKQIKPKIFSSSPNLKNDDSYSPRSPQLQRDDSLFEQQVQDKQRSKQDDIEEVPAHLGELKIKKIVSQTQSHQSPQRLEINQFDEEDYNDDDGYNDQFVESIGIGKSLSDIMERSYEGSSSIGQSNIQNNNRNIGFKYAPKRTSLGQSYSYSHIQTTNRDNNYRQHILIRQQAEKDQSTPQGSSKCLVVPVTEGNMTSESSVEYHKGNKSQLKWIFCIILLVIFIIFAGEWKMGKGRRSPKLKHKNR